MDALDQMVQVVQILVKTMDVSPLAARLPEAAQIGGDIDDLMLSANGGQIRIMARMFTGTVDEDENGPGNPDIPRQPASVKQVAFPYALHCTGHVHATCLLA
jgi:hypothetical protein